MKSKVLHLLVKNYDELFSDVKIWVFICLFVFCFSTLFMSSWSWRILSSSPFVLCMKRFVLWIWGLGFQSHWLSFCFLKVIHPIKRSEKIIGGKKKRNGYRHVCISGFVSLSECCPSRKSTDWQLYNLCQVRSKGGRCFCFVSHLGSTCFLSVKETKSSCTCDVGVRGGGVLW